MRKVVLSSIDDFAKTKRLLVSIFGPDRMSKSSLVIYESFSPAYTVVYDKKKDTASFVTKTKLGKPAKIPAVAKKAGLHKPTPIADFNKALQIIAKDVKIAKQEKEATDTKNLPSLKDGTYLVEGAIGKRKVSIVAIIRGNETFHTSKRGFDHVDTKQFLKDCKNCRFKPAEKDPGFSLSILSNGIVTLLY